MSAANGPKIAGYRLAAGPLSWRLCAEDGLEDWLAKFARILELEPLTEGSPEAVDSRRLMFLGQSAHGPGEQLQDILRSQWGQDLPRTGWQRLGIYPVFIWTHPQTQDVFCEVAIEEQFNLAVESMIKSCFPFYEQAVLSGGFPLHAALVSRDGRGVALAASGGTGKSTCSRRMPAPWKPLCDDTALVLPAAQNGFEAYPFATWSDYLWTRSEGTWNVASHVPLQAVFFLKQAEKDEAKPIGQGEAALYLSRSGCEILMPFLRQMGPDRARDLRRRVFDSACRLAKALPAFILEVSLEGEFWNEMERALGPPATNTRP
jgi:SynChlorMet cassette protein ScmC